MVINTCPTEAEAGAYALSLFAGQEPLIWFMMASTENPGAMDIVIHAKDVGGDNLATVTVWYEPDGTIYGEW